MILWTCQPRKPLSCGVDHDDRQRDSHMPYRFQRKGLKKETCFSHLVDALYAQPHLAVLVLAQDDLADALSDLSAAQSRVVSRQRRDLHLP